MRTVAGVGLAQALSDPRGASAVDSYYVRHYSSRKVGRGSGELNAINQRKVP